MKKNIIITLLSLLLLQTAVFAEAIKFVQITDTHFKNRAPFFACPISRQFANLHNPIYIRRMSQIQSTPFFVRSAQINV